MLRHMLPLTTLGLACSVAGREPAMPVTSSALEACVGGREIAAPQWARPEDVVALAREDLAAKRFGRAARVAHPLAARGEGPNAVQGYRASYDDSMEVWRLFGAPRIARGKAPLCKRMHEIVY